MQKKSYKRGSASATVHQLPVKRSGTGATSTSQKETKTPLWPSNLPEPVLPQESWLLTQAHSILGRPCSLPEAKALAERVDFQTRQPFTEAPAPTSRLRRAVAVVLATVGLASCAGSPSMYAICTKDDTITYTASGVSSLYMVDDVIKMTFRNRKIYPIYHKMEPGEVCTLEYSMTPVAGLL